MKLFKSKKGVVDNLAPLVIGLVSVGIIIAIGLLVMAEVQTNDKVMASENASSGVNATINAIDDIPTWLPIIVITVIGALLIGLVSLFRGRR